jgi:hypothetical protein
MRIFKPTFALASLGTTLALASCTLITDVDRTKIPTDAGAGTAGTGGGGGTGGSSGGSGGDAGDGSGGTPEGGSDGSGGKGMSGSSGAGGAGGDAGSSGQGGSAGAPVSCEKATGSISLAPQTFLSDGDTLTLRDGVNDAVVFEFDLATAQGVSDDNVAIDFDGTEDEAGLAQLIAAAINAQSASLLITAEVEGGGGNGSGEGGAGGDSGSAGASGGETGGESGAGAGGAGTAGSGGTGGTGATVVIALTHDAYGSLGNQKIDDTVGNPNFVNRDLTGGDSVGCDLTPTICNGDEDCAGSCDTGVNFCE